MREIRGFYPLLLLALIALLVGGASVYRAQEFDPLRSDHRPLTDSNEKPAKIIVVDDSSYAPFAFIDAAGQPQGISIDLWKLWSEKTGVAVEFRLMEWDSALTAVKEGQADAVGGIFRIPQREPFFDFISLHSTVATKLFFHPQIHGIRGLEDLSGFTVGVVKADSAEEWIRERYPHVRMELYPGAESLVKAALAGKIKVFLADALVARFYLAKLASGEEFREAINPVAVYPHCAAVRKGNFPLLTLLQQGFDRISEPDKQAIIEAWTGIPFFAKAHWMAFGTVFAAIAALFGVLVLWNFQLKRTVARATRDLEQRNKDLQRSERNYREIFNASSDMIFLHDALDGEILDMNQAAMDLQPALDRYGYAKQEHLGKYVGRSGAGLLPFNEEEALCRIRQAVTDGALVFEWLSQRRNGEAFWIEVALKSVHIGGENRVLSVGRDITERKRAEEALKQSEATLRSLFSAAPVGLVILNDHILCSVNERFCEIVGYASAELIGRDSRRFYETDAERQRVGRALYDTLWQRGSSYVETQFRRPDGIFREVSLYAAPLQVHDRRGDVALAVQDITDNKRAEAALRASEQRLRDIANNVPGVVYQFYVRSTGETGLYYISERADEIFGVGNHLEDAFTRFTAHVAPADRESFLASIQQAVATLRPWDFEGRFIKPTGETLWFKGVSSPTQFAQELVFSGVLLDITERKRAEERSVRDDAFRQSVIEGATDGICACYEVAEFPQVRFTVWNHRMIEITGYTLDEINTRGWYQSLYPDPEVQARASARMSRMRLGEDIDQEEWEITRKDGRRRQILISTRILPGGETGVNVLAVMTDVTARNQVEQRIEHLAYYDALTELPNRALLAQRAELALALAARHGVELAMLSLDLDRFKEVNDALGHAEGDALLAQVAARLQALIRAEDTVCRLGGDQFVLLAPDIGQDGALRLADKLLTIFRQPFVVAGHSLSMTVSVGIALYPHDGADFSELLKNADTALHRAKQDGRNTWAFYAREMNAATFERLVLEAELRQAIAVGQLRAYYQPKVRLTDGALVGAEALVRWQHPERGLIPPGQFIFIAEASDLIVALGNWMMAEVCRQMAAWRTAELPPLTVAVNLAARHFRLPQLADRVHGLLEAYGLPPQSLELELTESTLVETEAQTAETLQALERLGVGLSIDDFGTGYSNLAYLKRLPLTTLKIDRSFVSGVADDPDDRTLAATIVTLGHQMDLVVVAEGVETEEQRRILLEQGCDLAQGILFSHPLPADEFAATWLARAASPRQLTAPPPVIITGG
jgi:diguanylate cyclase (GGDEF)-like protein/PAS domain S-box-containing protein